jgi:type I restriction enzyme, R subunit
MSTDTSERGLESLIVAWMTGEGITSPVDGVHEPLAPYGGGWVLGDPHHYNRDYAIDLTQLTVMIH